MQKRILVVGDSMGLPRENVPYQSTWTYLLSQTISEYHFVFRLQRALHSGMINKGAKSDWLEYYTPHKVILQVGIVDCAPRYLKNKGITMKVLSGMPKFVNNYCWKLIKRFGRRSAKHADVSAKDFENNLRKYLYRCQRLNVEEVFLIKIARSGSLMVKSNNNILQQIKLYNSVLLKLADEFDNCIVINDLATATDDYFIEDGYHLNEKGNVILHDALYSQLKKQKEWDLKKSS